MKAVLDIPTIFLKKCRKVLYVVIPVAAVIVVILHLYFRGYPPPDQIRPELYFNPRQTPTRDMPFFVEPEGQRYLIVPQADYELYGLVVSMNPKSQLNFLQKIFGEYDFANTDDLCVVWGQNVATGVYQSMRFFQSSYACHYGSKEGRSMYGFTPTQLSHNHLLALEKGVSRELEKVKRGDQIYLRGNLADYYFDGRYLIRATSLIRGDHKCETVYLKDFKIIQPVYPVATLIRRWLTGLAVVCALAVLTIEILLFCYLPRV